MMQRCCIQVAGKHGELRRPRFGLALAVESDTNQFVLVVVIINANHTITTWSLSSLAASSFQGDLMHLYTPAYSKSSLNHSTPPFSFPNSILLQLRCYGRY